MKEHGFHRCRRYRQVLGGQVARRNVPEARVREGRPGGKVHHARRVDQAVDRRGLQPGGDAALSVRAYDSVGMPVRHVGRDARHCQDRDGAAGAVEDAGGGADVQVERDADIGVRGQAGDVAGLDPPGEQPGGAEDVAQAVPGPRSAAVVTASQYRRRPSSVQTARHRPPASEGGYTVMPASSSITVRPRADSRASPRTRALPRGRRPGRPEPGTFHACVEFVLILVRAAAGCVMGLPLLLPLTQVRGLSSTSGIWSR